MTMGDKIVVMKDGRIEQMGSPLELYDFPANMFVAGFIGSPAMNFLPGTLRRNGSGAELELADGTRLQAPTNAGGSDGQSVVLGTRPEHLQLAASGGIPSKVVVLEPTGADTFVACRHGATDVAAVFRERHDFAPGSTIHLFPTRVARTCSTPAAASASPPDRHSHRPPSHRRHHDDRPNLLQSPPLPRKLGRRRDGRDPRHRQRAALDAAFGQATSWKPEKDAKLRVLRWSRFVQGDIDQYMKNVAAFTAKTGVEVRVDNEAGKTCGPRRGRGQHRRRPGHHPVDQRRRQPLPDKLLDVTDVAEYIGKKYGGWYPPGRCSSSRTARSGSACRSAPPAR
jgi:hypothetical protein